MEKGELKELFKKYDSMLRYEQLHRGEVEPAEQTINLEITEEEYEFIVDQYLKNDNISFAICTAKQSFEKHPFSCDALIQLCDIYITDNQIDIAEKLLLKYMDSFELTPAIALSLSRISVRKGDLEHAKELYSKALELESDPSSLCDSFHGLAVDCLEKRYFNEALSLLDKAFDLNMKWCIRNGHQISDEELFGYYINYAHAYDGLENFDKAIEYLNKALDIDSFDDGIWTLIAEEYIKTDNPKKAQEALEYAFSLNKDNFQALLNLGIINLSLNNLDAAVENFTALSDSDPKNPLGMLMLATAHIAKGESSKAEFLYHKVLAIDPQNKEALNGLEFLENQKENNKGEEHIETEDN